MKKGKVTWKPFQSLESETINNSVPQKAGIYLFWVQLKDNKWKVFYVGQAKNLRARISDHLTESEKNKCIKENVNNYVCGFEYCLVGKQNDRDGVEKYLYEYFTPECNDNSPPSDEPIEINLPK